MTYNPQDLIAFFDVESTGLPLFKERSADPRQPHLVEVAALLYTREGECVDSFHAYVKPDGWTSDPEAFEAHGLTDEFLTVNGVDEAQALDGLLAILGRAAVRVAHNRNCDDRLVRAAIARHMSEDVADEFKDRAGECTALLSKPVCKLPPTDKMKASNFKNQFKTPTLAEAFAHLAGGAQLEKAHSAVADTQACARIYFLLKGVRMPAFPEDAQVLREEGDHFPHGKDECDAAQLDALQGVAP